MQIKNIVDYFEEIAPSALQEDYDNAGLIVGNYNDNVTGILISIDVTEEVVQEAIGLGVNLIIAHHPIVFSGLKRFNGSNYVERTVIKAIKNDVAILSVHTNIDSVIYNGVNTKICDKIGLTNTHILKPAKSKLHKLVVFAPSDYSGKIRNAIFNAGAGQIGNYDSCSFNSSGTGTFKAGENTNPFVGDKNVLHNEPEVKIETVVPSHLVNRAVKALIAAHPYEEPAYDIYPIDNEWKQVGEGMVGDLPEAIDGMVFLKSIKQIFNVGAIKYTHIGNKKIKKVAVCGGAGSFLLKDAIKSGADIFITGDFKYHQFFDAENQIIIADIGHFESEQFTKELFYDLLTIKFPNFATYLTNVNTNPIKYL